MTREEKKKRLGKRWEGGLSGFFLSLTVILKACNLSDRQITDACFRRLLNLGADVDVD